MSELPHGSITFLFTDIEGSTQLWESSPEAMKPALARHDTLMRSCVEGNGGAVVKTTGDGLLAVFGRATDGIAAALAAQRALVEEPWDPAIGQLLVRMALHTGTAEERGGDFFGPSVNRAARLMSAAHGGQVLLSQSAQDLVYGQLPEGMRLSDLGRHRLKDLTRPEHVFQLVADDLPSNFPPLRSLNLTPTNLPVQTTPFIGRGDEIALLSDFIAQSDMPLITLVGPGGVGKTRLAIEAAAQQGARFADGVFFVSLAPLGSPAGIVQAIAEAIGFPLSSQEDPHRQLLRHLRNRQYLLLLDNFEHLLSGAALVGEVLRQARRIQLLVTSRERLNLGGEATLRIEGLTCPPEDASPEDLDYGASELFISSATRLRPDFTVKQGDVPHIARICRLLEGMPLGILLAAAWIETLTPEEIAGEIGRSIDFLQAEWPDAPDRHQSVRAVYEPSWRQLTETQRELFAALSIFRGGFTREAAESVAGASLAELARLANKSLVRRDLETGRYEMHELLRQYAQEHLEERPQTFEAVSKTHATYFADHMRRQWHRLIGPEQQSALAAIDADLENLRQAWNYWLTEQAAWQVVKFVDAFARFYDVGGSFNTGAALFRRAADALCRKAEEDAEYRAESEAVCARVLAHSAYFKAKMGFVEGGYSEARESVAILRRINRPGDLAFALSILQWNATYIEEPLQAVSRELGDFDYSNEREELWNHAFVRCWQGRGAAWRGDLQLARQWVSESLRTFEELGDVLAVVWPLVELGHLAVREGAFEEARRQFERVLRISQDTNWEWPVTMASRYLGNIATVLNEFEEARRELLTSLRVADKLGLMRDIVSTVYDVATIEAAAGDRETAVKLLALIHRHPLSNQTRTFSVVLGEEAVRFVALAEDQLAKLEKQVPADAYAQALQAGKAMDIDAAVKELLGN